MAAQVQRLAGKTQIFVFKTAIPALKPRLTKFWSYAKVELKPPTPADLPAIKSEIIKLRSAAMSNKWKNVTTKEALLNTCVCLEVGFWFFVGECIGRRSWVGYSRVPGTFVVGGF